MKKAIKYILFITIIITIIVIHPYNSLAVDNYEKGELRCPTEYLNKGCTEIKTGNIVQEVRITESKDGYEITKIVTKKEETGHFDVKFFVQGGPSQITEYKDAYIVLIFDTSGSIKNSWGNVKEAIKKFGTNEKLQGSKFMVLQFANHISDKLKNYNEIDKTDLSKFFSSSIDVSKLCEYDTCGMDTASRVELALKYADTVLSHPSIPNDVKKYIILFGDGHYYNEEDTCWNKTICGHNSGLREREVGLDQVKNGHITNRLKVTDFLSSIKNHANYYGILYNGSGDKNANEEYMKKIVGNNLFDARKESGKIDYTTYFDRIAESIGKDIQEDPVVISAIVTDRLGASFKVGTSSQDVVQKIDNIAEGTYTNSFEIQIDDAVEDGWHDTNNGFDLTIEGQKITSVINPQVYWKQETTELHYCSDSISKSTKSVQSTDYYSITCNQGYGNTPGFSAILTIFNLPLATRAFTLNNGEGFTASLNLSSNLQCSYEFNSDKFLGDYNSKLNEYNSITGTDKESVDNKLILQQEIKDLEKKLADYNKSVEDLSILYGYKTKFENQNARMNVKYKTTGNKEVNLENDGNVNSDISCDVDEKSNILGISTYIKRVCTLKSIKNMHLANACLDIKSAEAESCVVDSKTQILGGNKFYVPGKETKGGYVSLYIDNATITNDSIILEGDKRDSDNYRCEFSLSSEELIFRQIDVADPFVQSLTDNTRNIGRNFSNLKYNFVNIIDANIWNTNPEYVYYIGKANVENIKSDTLSSVEKVNSYLGSNCTINEKTNVYSCPFVSDATGSINKNFFTNVEIRDSK